MIIIIIMKKKTKMTIKKKMKKKMEKKMKKKKKAHRLNMPNIIIRK